jgi:hypothetical protein
VRTRRDRHTLPDTPPPLPPDTPPPPQLRSLLRSDPTRAAPKSRCSRDNTSASSAPSPSPTRNTTSVPPPPPPPKPWRNPRRRTGIVAYASSPRSSGDRAPPSGGGGAGSNPAGGTHDDQRISIKRCASAFVLGTTLVTRGSETAPHGSLTMGRVPRPTVTRPSSASSAIARCAVPTDTEYVAEWIHWQTGAALLLPRLLSGRAAGPVFLADRKQASARSRLSGPVPGHRTGPTVLPTRCRDLRGNHPRTRASQRE